MAVVDTGDIIKVDFEDGDDYGNSYDDGWNRQRVYDAIGDESIMEKIPDTDIYILHNRALHIGTENPDTYFFDDAGGALIWRGSVDEVYLFDNEGYCKIDGITAICEISNKRWDTRNNQEMEFINSSLHNFKIVYIEKSKYKNYIITGDCNIIDYGYNDIINTTHRKSNYGIWIRGSSNIDNLQIIDAKYGLFCNIAGVFTLESIQLINCETNIRYGVLLDRSFVLNIINSIVDPESYEINVNSDQNVQIESNLQNRFQIYIENGANASATLKDKDGNEIISGTLDSEGKWLLDDPITWVQRYLETEDGELVEDQLNYFEPFSLEVKKNGLQDLVIPNIRCSIYDSEKDKRLGSLEDTVVEGQMVKKNYVDRNIQGNIELTKELQGEIEVIELKGEVS